MRSCDLLPHRCQKTLWVEETSHPEHVRSTVEQPARELCVPIEQVREPESDCSRLPRDLPDTTIKLFNHINFVTSAILCNTHSFGYCNRNQREQRGAFVTQQAEPVMSQTHGTQQKFSLFITTTTTVRHVIYQPSSQINPSECSV